MSFNVSNKKIPRSTKTSNAAQPRSDGGKVRVMEEQSALREMEEMEECEQSQSVLPGDIHASPGSQARMSDVRTNNNYTQFEVTFPVQSEYIKHLPPKRFQQKSMQQKQISAEQIQEKQRLAGERKKKLDEHKSKQAKKVSEDAIRFDKMVTGRLAVEQSAGQPAWYRGALKNVKKDTK